MATYRLLFFHGTRLKRWKQLEAASYPEALDEAARGAMASTADCVELWSIGKRIATFKARLGREI